MLFEATAQAHGHSHRHSATAHSQVEPDAHAGNSASAENGATDEEDGHSHSGDPLKDLLTLGHNHIGSSCPGLPPAAWILAAAPHVSQPVVSWPDRAPGDSPPDNPFRPPIA